MACSLRRGGTPGVKEVVPILAGTTTDGKSLYDPGKLLLRSDFGTYPTDLSPTSTSVNYFVCLRYHYLFFPGPEYRWNWSRRQSRFSSSYRSSDGSYAWQRPCDESSSVSRSHPGSGLPRPLPPSCGPRPVIPTPRPPRPLPELLRRSRLPRPRSRPESGDHVLPQLLPLLVVPVDPVVAVG